MKITSINHQIKLTDRYSIFVDGKFAFSLSEGALLDSKIIKGQELDKEALKELKRLSNEDKLYVQSLRLVASRPKTLWEVKFYLEQKGVSPTLIEYILNKLSKIGLIDDEQYAINFVSNRVLLRPSSRRKIFAELRKKRVAEEIIEKALSSEPENDRTALAEVIARKRRQTKYKDNLKLMQYLARQGYNYEDIKSALANEEEI